MTHSHRILLMLGTETGSDSTRDYRTGERHGRIPTLDQAWLPPFLAGAYLSLIEANSDLLLGTLLLGQIVSSETSHLSYSPGAEEKQAQRSPNPPGAQVHSCTRGVVVGDGEDRRTVHRVAWMWLFSSFCGGGLTLLMRLSKLGLFNCLLTGDSFRFGAIANYVFQETFLFLFLHKCNMVVFFWQKYVIDTTLFLGWYYTNVLKYLHLFTDILLPTFF